MKKVFLFLTVLLFALGISAPVYSGGSQNNVPEVTGPFMQDPDEITYGDGYEYNYYTGESQEDYRKLRVAHSTGDIFERSVDTESFIQLVRPRYAKSHNVYDRKIVEIDYINSWDKNGKRTTIEAIMREEAYFGSYIINTLFEGYDESGQPMGDFVEFATYSYDPETYGDGRKFGVILPGSRVEFQSGRFINILSGAIGWDNDFEAARELEDFMIYLAENVDYDKMKSKVDKTKAAFDALKAKGITNKCPSTPPCACYGDIYKHIIHAANFQAGLWGGFLGAIPPIVLPAKYYSVRKQYAIQANLAASIGYMHGYYPRGGEEFKQRLKIDNFFLFAGHGPDAISFDTILSNFVKEEIIEEYIGDIPGGVNRAKEFYENPTEIPLSYYEDVFEEVKDALIEAIDDKLEDLLPKAISWIPIAGTLWDAGEGAKEAIQETQDMGSRAVKYFRMPRDFYFDPRPNYIITAYIGSDVNVTVPDMIDGDKVKVIAADTFKDKKNDIESVTFLSEGIKTIPANLFADCTSLKTVTFGKSIASIGDKGFYNCPQLTTVTLGGDIKSIGAAAFSGCRQLTTVNIPPNVKKITFGVNAFEGTNLDYATKLRLRKLGYKGAGVGEGFFIVNNTGATIVFIDKKVGSGWSTELTKSVRNGQTVEVELAPGMYDIQLRATTNYPAGDIFRKWDIRVEDTTRITFTADDRYTMERADYQAFIQARCLFYNPASVWEVIDTHAFADSVYKTWAESYPNIPGRRYPFKRPGRRTDQQIIQSLCKFSSPQTVWEVVNTHPNHETIMNVWADSYFNEGGIIDGIAGIIKGLLDGDDNGDIDETITQITPVPTPIPVSVGDYKPAPLPTNATFQQALEKLDEIIAFCDANPSSANNTARYGCNSMRELWEPNSDDLEPNWPIMASANINAINRTIASLDSGTAPQIAPSEAGTFKLTGIPSQYNGKYAVAVGGGNIGPFNDTIAIIGAQDYIRYPTSTTAAPIRGGQVAMNLWTVERLLQSPYRGNHSLSVIIYIVDEASGEDFDEAEHYIGFESVAFRNGGATMAWNDGIVDGVYSSTDPGTFTLTGIPSQYNGKYAMIDAEAAGVFGVQTIAMAGGEPIMTSAPIRSGRAAINLWRLTPVGFAPYKGSDTFKVTVMIYNQGTVTAAEADYITEELSVEFANVSFRNGVATLAWSAGTVVEGPPPPPPVTHTYSSAWSFDETQHWHDCTDRDGAKSGVANHTSGNTCTVCGYWKWTAVADSTFGNSRINAIAYGNNRFVAVGWDGKMAYSTDNGVTWTAVADSTFPATFTTTSGRTSTSLINAVAYGNGRFIAVGSEGKMAYSADGVSWTAVADSGIWQYPDYRGDPITASILAIAFGNNRFVAIANKGKMAYSSNGTNWTAVSDTTFDYPNNTIGGIIYANNRWVAVGSNNIAYSSDGAAWTAVPTANRGLGGTNGSFNGVAFGKDRFVAVGNNGRIAYSADGASWTAVPNTASFGFGRSISDGITAVAYGNGRFVAVGTQGKIVYCDW